MLSLETNEDHSDREQLTSADEASADEDAAEEAQAQSIAPHAVLDNEFSDSKVAQCPAISTQEIVMQVSSKHLSLASKVFDNMFQGQPRDDIASHDRKPVTIPLLKDDFESLQTLLYIVHGRTRRVSRLVERSQLLRTVVLIDKYEFHEVAEVFTDIWFDSLRPEIPHNLHQDLAPWIYTCWELRKSEEFNTLTQIAIRETNCGLEDPDALVPYWITGKRSPLRNNKDICSNHTDEIQSYRQNILTEFLLTLSRLLELYGSSHRQCHQDPDCDALALGKLIQGLKNAGLYPVPEPSTLKRPIQELFSTVRAIDLSALCEKSTKKVRRRFSLSEDEKSFQTCHLYEAMRASLSVIEDGFQGLKINESSRNDEIRT